MQIAKPSREERGREYQFCSAGLVSFGSPGNCRGKELSLRGLALRICSCCQLFSQVGSRLERSLRVFPSSFIPLESEAGVCVCVGGWGQVDIRQMFFLKLTQALLLSVAKTGLFLHSQARLAPLQWRHCHWWCSPGSSVVSGGGRHIPTAELQVCRTGLRFRHAWWCGEKLGYCLKPQSRRYFLN